MKHLKLFNTTQKLTNVTDIDIPSVYYIANGSNVMYLNGSIPVSFLGNDSDISGTIIINNVEMLFDSAYFGYLTMIKAPDNLLTIGDILPSASVNTYCVFKAKSGYDFINPINVNEILSDIGETVETMRGLYNNTDNYSAYIDKCKEGKIFIEFSTPSLTEDYTVFSLPGSGAKYKPYFNIDLLSPAAVFYIVKLNIT